VGAYHIREAGSTAAQEVAFAFAIAIAYLEAGVKAGLNIDDFAPRVSWIFNTHINFLEEVAKFRAARRFVGADHEGTVWGEGSAVVDATLSYANRRMYFDGAAAFE